MMRWVNNVEWWVGSWGTWVVICIAQDSMNVQSWVDKKDVFKWSVVNSILVQYFFIFTLISQFCGRFFFCISNDRRKATSYRGNEYLMVWNKNAGRNNVDDYDYTTKTKRNKLRFGFYLLNNNKQSKEQT